MAWHGCRKRPQLLTSTYPLLHTKQQSGRKQKTKAQKEEIKEEEKGVETWKSILPLQGMNSTDTVELCPHALTNSKKHYIIRTTLQIISLYNYIYVYSTIINKYK